MSGGVKQDDIIASMSPFLPLMHTWTFRTCEGPPGGPPQVNTIELIVHTSCYCVPELLCFNCHSTTSKETVSRAFWNIARTKAKY